MPLCQQSEYFLLLFLYAVVQELLRHVNSRITLDVCTQAVNSHKCAAQSKVVQMIVHAVGTATEGTGTEA